MLLPSARRCSASTRLCTTYLSDGSPTPCTPHACGWASCGWASGSVRAGGTVFSCTGAPCDPWDAIDMNCTSNKTPIKSKPAPVKTAYAMQHAQRIQGHQPACIEILWLVPGWRHALTFRECCAHLRDQLQRNRPAAMSGLPQSIPDCCQVIDSVGAYQPENLERFVKQHGVLDARTNYQVVAIMGPQSSGKSTLMNHVVGIVRWWAARARTCHLV